MQALWLPDPAILRRGEVPQRLGASCMQLSAKVPPRQLIAQVHGRRMPVRECRAAATTSLNRGQPADDPTIVVEGGLPRAAVVGVLGGGQLGKMLAIEAARVGVECHVLDPSPDCPASAVARQVVGSFKDSAAVVAFAKDVDVLTVEIEHINADAMQQVASELRCDVEPTPWTLRTIQDKLLQKQHFQSHGIPLADFRSVGDAAELSAAGEEFGFPFMLKSRRLAYDGRGNAVVRSSADLESALAALGGYEHGLYAERWCRYQKELAVMVARSRGGETRAFPVVETVQKDSICHVTEAPAQVSNAARQEATRVAERAVATLEGAGVFGVEMFLLEGGEVLLNEVAPRPHNSGHYSIEACASSQYEQHLRGILGWPLGDSSLTVGAAIMLNVLGEADGADGMRRAHQLMGRAYKVPGATVHWYGKAEVTRQRKVGHVTITAATPAEARARLALIDPTAARSLEGTAPASASTGSSSCSAAPPRVGVIMGSDSDLATMAAAAQVLKDFGVPAEVTVVSAHRTPDRMLDYARGAAGRGIQVIIAGAGGAAHLPGMVAALTPLPVIGVPVKPTGAHLDGLDALLSIVQMPKGVPVATVAIGNAANAGLLAVRVLAASDARLQEKMVKYQDDMRSTVLKKAEKLEARGWKEYAGYEQRSIGFVP